MGYKDRAKGRQVQVQRRMGSGQFTRLEKGRNIIRLFPFEHKVTEEDIKRGIYDAGEVTVGKTEEEIDCFCPVHFTGDGMVNCLLKGCELCAGAQRLMAGDKSDQKAGRDLSVSKRYYVNAVNMEEGDKKVQTYVLPQSGYLRILSFINDPDYEDDELLGCKGRDFIIEYDKDKPPSDMYVVKMRDASKSDELDDDVEEGVRDLIELDTLKPGASPKSAPEESDRPKKEEKKSGPKRKSSTKKKEEKKEMEKPEKFKKGDFVSWEYEEETFTGKVTNKANKDGEYPIKDTTGEAWDVEYDDLTMVDLDAVPF